MSILPFFSLTNRVELCRISCPRPFPIRRRSMSQPRVSRSMPSPGKKMPALNHQSRRKLWSQKLKEIDGNSVWTKTSEKTLHRTCHISSRNPVSFYLPELIHNGSLCTPSPSEGSTEEHPPKNQEVPLSQRGLIRRCQPGRPGCRSPAAGRCRPRASSSSSS